MLRLLIVAALASLMLTFSPAASADDLKAMEGVWRVESLEANGQPVDSGELKNQELTISGDRYSMMSKDGPDAGTLTLDATRSPRTMDAKRTEGFEAGKVVKAIYQIDGDTLRVCVSLGNGERPTEMTTKQDSGWVLITYKRQSGR